MIKQGKNEIQDGAWSAKRERKGTKQLLMDRLISWTVKSDIGQIGKKGANIGIGVRLDSISRVVRREIRREKERIKYPSNLDISRISPRGFNMNSVR